MKITSFGILARGRKELIKHLNGERLTPRQMALAKCYECMGGYADGRRDCLIAKCPIYPLMPFRGKEEQAATGE
jgi:hypothetical protein